MGQTKLNEEQVDLKSYKKSAQTTQEINTAVTAHNASGAAHEDLRTALAGKQNKLTAGANISIVGDVISATGGGAGGTVDVDGALSDTSTNPVQNKVLKAALDAKQDKLTDARLAAADSGITSAKVSGYDDHVDNTGIHVTAEQKTTWTAKQDAIGDLATIRSNAAAGAEAAENKVSKSGDTMTGPLTVNPSIKVLDDKIVFDPTTPPANPIYGREVCVKNNAADNALYVSNAWLANGEFHSRLGVNRRSNNVSHFAEISAAVDVNNVPRGYAPNPPTSDNTNSIATTQWVKTLIKDYVVESFKDNSGSWYRKYKSGWLEQGGVTPALEIPLTPSSSVATVTFLKPFSKLYSCHVSPSSYAASVVMDFGSPLSAAASNNIWARSITDVVITVDKDVKAIWYAAGQGA